MRHKPGTPLDRIEGFPKEHTLKLAALSIDTAEEFLSVTNTLDKRERIAVYLEIDWAGTRSVDRHGGTLPAGERG